MASVADFTLTALIKADASGFRAGIQDAKGALESLQSSSGNKLQKISDSFVGVGKALTAGLTLPLAAVGGASLKAFSEYDTALIGVRKTTDISGDALKRFSKQIMRLSREMPNSAVEIANLAEVAGQLGIRTDEGGKHLINFSKIAAQMGTATNMSSEQAANAMARLANITQMPQTQFHRLGSTIVALGNNLATTESEIADMSLRLAGTGHQIGLTEAQIAGLAAGMSSVGINAEAGGSAFSRVMQKMNTDVLSGGEGLQRFAAVAGKTAEEFAQTWRTNPQEAIVDFVKGLGKVKESGGDVTETLKDLGINSIREIDTLARLAGAGDLLAKSFGIANKAWADGTALQKEADAASESFANQLKKLKNALFEAGTVIGGQLAPHVGKLAEDIRKVVQAFNDLDPKVQANIVNFGLFLAKIGPAIYIVGKIIGMISKISLAISFISKLATAFKAAGGAIAGFKAIIALTGGPIAWIIAAIMALVGVITYLWTTNEGFRNAITGIWEAIKQVFSTAWEFIQSVWSAAPEFFSGIWEQIISTATPMWEEFVNSMGPLVEAFKNLWNSVVDFFVVLGEQIKPIWEDIKQFFSDTWGIIRGIFELALALLAPIVQVGFEVIQTIISTVWELIKIIIQTAWTIITTIISTAINIVADILRTVTAIIQGDWQGAWDAIKSIAETLWNAILTIGQTLFNALKSAIENILNAIQSIWSAVWNAVSSVTSSIWNAIVSIISNAMSTMQNAVSNGINAVKTLSPTDGTLLLVFYVALTYFQRVALSCKVF
ncbi:TPA: phage tail tape measure protein [Streptococcus pyogenes]|nr:phage tail tape measure protein [Streptococcus pyogenes]HER7303592.1 phage tail tape measure protein [Streptococcus pyogenes]